MNRKQVLWKLLLKVQGLIQLLKRVYKCLLALTKASKCVLFNQSVEGKRNLIALVLAEQEGTRNDNCAECGFAYKVLEKMDFDFVRPQVLLHLGCAFALALPGKIQRVARA